ncbi:hypothetical protein TNCV_2527901 [Trichonephila clavipes]|nr:hypothetical protein TNCV_2527901 [Trichonephila clavipes]
MSDSDSDMDLNSEKSGYSYKSRSSRSGTPNFTTFTSECQTLKNVMKRIWIVEKTLISMKATYRIPHHEALLMEPVLTQNTFENLEQDVEPSLNTENNVENINENESIVPKPKLHSPIMLTTKNITTNSLK